MALRAGSDNHNDKLQITDDRMSRSKLVRPARTSLRTADYGICHPVILSSAAASLWRDRSVILIILYVLAELVGEQGRLSRDPTVGPGDRAVEPLCFYPCSVRTRFRQLSYPGTCAGFAGTGLAPRFLHLHTTVRSG